MKKPTYYLWLDQTTPSEEIQTQKEHLSRMGFRVVIFCEGQKKEELLDEIKWIIQNHAKEVPVQ